MMCMYLKRGVPCIMWKLRMVLDKGRVQKVARVDKVVLGRVDKMLPGWCEHKTGGHKFPGPVG